jgi:hypothetical protein
VKPSTERLARASAALAALSACALSPLALPACAREAPLVEAPMASADASVEARAPVASLDAGARPAAVTLPFAPGDRYSGHYHCAQGRTEVTLVIEGVSDDAVDALFEFAFPGSATFDPAEGTYRMRGTFDPRQKALRLAGERWVDQPEGYTMSDLSGTVTRTGAIEGRLHGPGCTSFLVTPERQRPPERGRR